MGGSPPFRFNKLLCTTLDCRAAFYNTRKRGDWAGFQTLTGGYPTSEPTSALKIDGWR